MHTCAASLKVKWPRYDVWDPKIEVIRLVKVDTPHSCPMQALTPSPSRV